MSRKPLQLVLSGLLALALGQAAYAQLPWSEDTHQIAFGDFNGDGKTDLLYVAKSSGANSGIALSNNAGPYNVAQTWASNYLGIAWHSSTYRPIVGDFNGDGKADVFMQRQAQGDHYVLLSNSAGQLTAINQTVPFNLAGQIWSADGHRIVSGDFNGDARTDLFLQSATPAGLNAVFLASAGGTFSSAQQTWSNVHLGFKWSAQNAAVQAGDFNGDGKADLLVQAKPDIALIDYEIAFPVPVYPPGRFGIANAKATNGNGEVFYTPALQIWDRRYQNVDWSAANYNAIVGDFNGDGRADILLQGRRAGMTNSEFVVSSGGQVTSGNVLSDPVLLTATQDQFRLYSANFDGAGGSGVYLQSVSSGGASSIAWNSATTSSWAETYEYDALGRLRKVNYPNGTTTNYNFDAAGNRTNVITSAP
jgi:YD repeat-containing protein